MKNNIFQIKKVFLEIAREEEKKIAKGRLIELWEPQLLKMVKAREPSINTQKLRQAVLLAGKEEIKIHTFPNDVYEQHYRFSFRKKEIPLSKEEKIKKITLIKIEEDFWFAVNDYYKEIKKVPKYSEWWEIFVKEIKDRNVSLEKRTDTKEIPKKMVDFFNYNKKCAIYFGGKYKLTNIFIGQGIDIRLNPEIKTEIISGKQYQRRKRMKK